MARDVPPRRATATNDRRIPPLLSLCALVIVASQAWPWLRLPSVLPAPAGATRTPSSDVLLQAVPLENAGETIATLARDLPQAPGVIVAHGRSDALASAYMVLAMRLWPRPVTYVACLPRPHVEQFHVPHAVPAPAWRLDVRPGAPVPLGAARTTSSDAATLCAAPSLIGS